MTHRPRIPMRPTELPQQRLYLVKGVPTPPPGWAPLETAALDTYKNARMPRSARYLGQVEWAWSPANSRISAYYLSMDRRHRHWLLWLKPYDDNWGRWDQPQVDAAAPRQRLDARTAAKLLLAHAWAGERDQRYGLDRFHWVNEDESLEAGEFNEIGDAVWGQEPQEASD